MRIFDGPPSTGRGGQIEKWNWVVVAALWILFGPAAALRAQGVRYDNIVLGPRGGPVAGATIAVCSAGASTSSTPCSPLATIYSEEALTQPLANPFPADSLGNYGFWAAPGHYIVQIYGAGITTRTMNVFLPCDPSNCSMSSATFSSITAGTLNLSGALTVNGRTVATEAKNTDAVLYVSPNGSDSNDGFSWGSAKQTLYAAVAAVENSTVGGGTVYVAANTACGGPVSGQGLWLVGDNDSAHSSPPSGWIYADWPLRIIGVGTTAWVQNASEPGVALNCGSDSTANLPGLWLSGTNRPLYFANLDFSENYTSGLRMGVDTTGSRSSNTGASGVVFDDVQFSAKQQGGTASGPAVDIGTNVFWVWFKHVTVNANASATALSDQHQAMAIYPGASGSCEHQSGYIWIEHSQFNGGGVHFYGSCENGGSLYVNGLTTENQQDGSPAVWITTSLSNIYSGAYHISNVGVSDSVNPTYAVQVDNTCGNCVLPASDATIVSNVMGVGQNTNGPMTILGPQPWEGIVDQVKEPSLMGQIGFFNDRVYGQVDAARRLFPPQASRWTNIAPTLPTSWSISQNTTTNYVTGPDGVSNSAVDVVSTSGTGGVMFVNGNNITYAAGDYLIAGAWVRSINGGSTGSGHDALSLSVNSACSPTYIYGNQYFGEVIKGDGQWEWDVTAIKVGTAGSCGTYFSGGYDTTHEMQFFAPMAIHIPAGEISDNEAADIAQNLGNYPYGLNPPVESTLMGHPFAFGGSGDNYFAILDHTGLTVNRTFLFPDTNGTVCLSTTCGSQVGQISISSATSGSHSFTSSYASTPICVVSPTSSPGTTTWWVTATTTAVTVNVSASTTLSFNYACFGNPD